MYLPRSINAVVLLAGLFTILLFAGSAAAQGGFINPDIDMRVYNMAVQPDGKILVCGDFSNAGGQPRSRAVRVNANGSLDTGFQDPLVVGQDSSNNHVYGIARQSDGKVLIGGLFLTVGGSSRPYLARLNSDGTLDTGFAPAVNNTVISLALQPDGKILIGGYFTSVGGQSRTAIARLNADGTRDTGFQDPAINQPVGTIAVQADGKILVGGNFTSIGAGGHAFGARLAADGTFDAGFTTVFNGPVSQFAIQPDGKIFACGFFGFVNSTARTGLARIAADGSLDTTFQNAGIPSGNVTAMDIQADGKIVVGGEFSTISGQTRDDLARLNADGTFDASFQDPNTNFGGQFFSINAIRVQTDGKVLIGGDFTTIGHQPRKNLGRLNADGTLDVGPAQTFTVTKTADTADGTCDADCSLREAVTAANGVASPSAINFADQAFSTPQTVTLTAGELVIEDNHKVSVTGAGAALLTISGNDASRIFRVRRDATLSVTGLTITNGNGAGGVASNEGGAIYVEANGVVTQLNLTNTIISNSHATTGGAIRSSGQSTITIDNSTITGNLANYTPAGGGIYFDNGVLTITHSTISNNTADFMAGSGGGVGIGNSSAVFNLSDSIVTGNTGVNTGGIAAGGTTTITNTTISNNHATSMGGGLSAMSGNVTLSGSTVSGNTVSASDGTGGGIVNFGRLTITNTMVSNNSAVFGAGIFTAGGLTGTGVTISANTCVGNGNGAGIYNNAGGTSGLPVTLTSSLITGNNAAGFGGGVHNRDTMNLVNTTVRGNVSSVGGGGIFNVFLNVGTANLTVTGSTINANISNAAGGGIQNQSGTVTLVNSTVSGNNARGLGGGINNSSNGTIDLTHATVAFNIAVSGTGGGINNAATVTTRNSIIAKNVGLSQTPSPDFKGTLNSDGYNLVGDTTETTITGTTTGNILGQDPMLDGVLRNNGGATLTHILHLNSPAIDQGRANTPAIVTDQRGSLRPFDFATISNAAGGNGADMGAIERQASDSDQYRSPYDFDGDGKTDLSIFRPGPGEWWYQKSSNGGNGAATFGSGTDRITPGDFTGDGKTDIAIWRPSTGEWFALRSEDNSYYSFPFGTSGDIPAPADFDADGKTDAAVFRPSTATWFISKSTGGTTIQQFGVAGDVPVTADYDGDGKSDVAIYRPSAGEWWIQRSTAGLIAFTFGNSSDKTVPGDYTGDGKADVGIWRPSTGEWFILRSENQSYYSFPFGTSGDVPSPGDYDGDGKTDAGIFRTSSSTWFINRSGGGTLIQQFGQAGDMPVPGAFVR